MSTTLPHDEQAERGLIGCLCETAQPPENFDPAWIYHSGRRALFLALDMLRNEGDIVPMIDSLNPHHVERVRFANAELAAGMVEQAGTWDCVGDPRRELLMCLDESTHYQLIDYYARRLQAAARRRMGFIEGDRMMRDAMVSA